MRCSGVSLVELVLALAIIAVVASISTYTYQEWRSYADAEQSLTQLISAMTVVESYALSSGRTVTLCKTRTGNACDGDNWSQGLLVFFDDENQHQVVTAADRIKISLNMNLSGSLSFYGFPSSHYWQYQPKVSKEQQNGTFVYCDMKQNHQDWRMVISKTGRYRVEKARDERC